MAAWKLGPALATGCTVVLKPAKQTPRTAILLGELSQDAGIPDGVVDLVSRYEATAGAALASAHSMNPKFDLLKLPTFGNTVVSSEVGSPYHSASVAAY